MPPWSHVAVLSWAGMRGVVSLAAALALRAEFPGRDTILLLAFCAILATLVLQSTTLSPLIRRLGVSEFADEPANPAVTPEAIDARGTAAATDVVAEKIDDPEQAEVAEDLLRDLRVRAKRGRPGAPGRRGRLAARGGAARPAAARDRSGAREAPRRAQERARE